MSQTYDNIFFDLDGTLCDSTLGIDRGVLYALERMGIQENAEGVKKIIGLPLHLSLRKFYFKNEKDTWKAVNLFRDYYGKKGIYESKFYHGIKTMLRQLSKIAKLHIVTAKPTPYAIEVARHHSVDSYFENILGCKLSGGHFSKGDEIKKILKFKKRYKAVMVGDREVDIKAGKENNIDTIGILYGYGSHNEMINCGASRLASSVKELKQNLL